MAKSDRKTRIAEDWQPDDAGREFAATNGVQDTEIGAFVDYHLAKGDTMASWPAAWRTWCRNAVKYGTARRTTVQTGLVLAWPCPADDPWGVTGWAGNAVPMIRNADAAWWFADAQMSAIAREICEAADIPRDIRPDLDLIVNWINLRPKHDRSIGEWPDMITAAIRAAQRRPDRPNLRWYDGLVRQLADRKRA